MKSYLRGLGLLFLLISSFAQASGFDGRYSVRTGDLNSDGRTDIYLRYMPRVVLIPVGNTQAPIPIPSDVGEFVLQQNSSGDFTLLTSLTSTQKNTVNQWATQAAISILTKDYNLDNVVDILLKGIGAVISGAHNVIVYASSTKGAPPSVVANVNASLTQFITDVGGFSDNPNYFASGVSVQCQWVYIYTLHYDPEIGYYYTSDPYLICQFVFDPGSFSIPAINFLNRFVPAANAGEIIAQSSDATSMSQILQQIFGTPFFKGTLEFGGTGDAEGCQVIPPQAIDACLKYERLARLVDVLADLSIQSLATSPCSDGETHHYDLNPSNTFSICPTNGNHCSTSNVYWEQLTHPAPGYFYNNTPIYNGQPGTAWTQPIVFHVNKPILWHQNETLPGHVFDPGTVTRQTIISGNSIFITTVGTGTGKCKTFNEIIGPALFRSLDAQIANHVNFGITASHDPIP